LRPGQTAIEASSGNTGIALAMVCARKGYPLVVVMAENFSVERRRLMRFLGARVVLTPAAQKGSGMMRKAEELAAKHGWFLCRQFENPVNAQAHARTTAPEILEAFADASLDFFVAGCGTGGTVTGVAQVLRRERPETCIVVCEPDNAPMLGSGVPQPRDGAGVATMSHPAFRPHPLQGWGPDIVPKITESAFAAGLVDRVIPVNGRDAMRLARELAQKEGIFTGITGGATLAGALAVATTAASGSNILCLLPDTGERYQSTPLFADVPVDMTDEELEISRSTACGRFDVAAPAAPPPPTPVAVDREAEEFVRGAVSDSGQPVVMFALEWCEFCWSLRRLFARYGVPFRSIDLDSVEYQAADLGGRIRAALVARTGIATIPQVFVGGELLGGCTDVVDALLSARLQPRLARLGVPFDSTFDGDPRAFLPGWLHPR
ncbi:MAG TPA: pyridoxal-phosphate dependent enzyme, partial [Steroidobacteraceae bacterium]|nr:pyridoxal-phosphate dependent enzyme [Steroidobacteraceae bacterium]